MSRIFEDEDAKAMILVVAILVGLPLIAAIASPPKHSAPAMVANQSVSR